MTHEQPHVDPLAHGTAHDCCFLCLQREQVHGRLKKRITAIELTGVVLENEVKHRSALRAPIGRRSEAPEGEAPKKSRYHLKQTLPAHKLKTLPQNALHMRGVF